MIFLLFVFVFIPHRFNQSIVSFSYTSPNRIFVYPTSSPITFIQFFFGLLFPQFLAIHQSSRLFLFSSFFRPRALLLKFFSSTFVPNSAQPTHDIHPPRHSGFCNFYFLPLIQCPASRSILRVTIVLQNFPFNL